LSPSHPSLVVGGRIPVLGQRGGIGSAKDEFGVVVIPSNRRQYVHESRRHSAADTYYSTPDCLGEGDGAALDQLIPVVYKELRRLAQWQMIRERPGCPQATALGK
jgi:hypothetical protein